MTRYYAIVGIAILSFVNAADVSISSNCDCGYNDPSFNSNWNEMWHMSFEEKTNFGGGNQYLYSHKDLFFSNYEVPAKFNDPYSRVFRRENIVIRDESLEIGVTLNGPTNGTNNSIHCGGIGTTRQDFLYGSFRSFMRTTKVEGTVTGMFIFHPEGEIDIEMLGSVKPSQAYFAMHPGLTENGKASALTHGNYLFDFDPTQEYHEYRFDWYPDLTVFFIDGIESYRMTTNILKQPSRLMFNHWTDGNQNFSQGPAKENAFINIKNMTLFFNSSDALMSTPKCINVNNTCNIEKIVTTLKDKNMVFDSYLTSSDQSNNNSPYNVPPPRDSSSSKGTASISSNVHITETFIYLFITLAVACLIP